MVSPIEAEPRPRLKPGFWARPCIESQTTFDLPRSIHAPDVCFFAVLNARRSGVGGPLSLDDLASVLWHAMLLRGRQLDGRFGLPWESRSAPSAGGLHTLGLVSLPLDTGLPMGLYEPDKHQILQIPGCVEMQAENRRSVRDLANAQHGVTLQILSDSRKLEACYENSRSLMWRDVGALVSVVCLVATALELQAIPLGRIGNEIVGGSGLAPEFEPAGAVHLSKIES
ncbi:MAG: hypothetical protein AAFX81_01785 [Pseudomonadota bacterium]